MAKVHPKTKLEDPPYEGMGLGVEPVWENELEFDVNAIRIMVVMLVVLAASLMLGAWYFFKPTLSDLILQDSRSHQDFVLQQMAANPAPNSHVAIFNAAAEGANQ